MMYMYSYDNQSESGLKIKEDCHLPLIKHVDSKFKASRNTTVLNWGCSDLPRQVRMCNVINTEQGVYNAVNKLRCLTILSDNFIPTPSFTTDPNEIDWEGLTVCRYKLTGHDGEGVAIHNEGDEIRPAKLYVEFIEGDEYRVTMAKDGTVFGVQKRVRLDTPPPNGYNDRVRTTSGGYGFAPMRNRPLLKEVLIEQALNSLEALGLDFGAVDFIVPPIPHGNDVYVLEVNTAPQMTPYVHNNFCTWVRNKNNEEQPVT